MAEEQPKKRYEAVSTEVPDDCPFEGWVIMQVLESPKAEVAKEEKVEETARVPEEEVLRPKEPDANKAREEQLKKIREIIDKRNQAKKQEQPKEARPLTDLERKSKETGIPLEVLKMIEEKKKENKDNNGNSGDDKKDADDKADKEIADTVEEERRRQLLRRGKIKLPADNTGQEVGDRQSFTDEKKEHSIYSMLDESGDSGMDQDR